MEEKSIFKRVANYKELHVYQKAEVLVLLTDVFCKRFLPLYGDRRVDQMNMAARCGKQNIVEGCEDGQTSTEMEVRLVNVGRSSFQELREDYEDYLKRNNLQVWDKNHPRFDKMVAFCRANNDWQAYKPLSETLSAEEFCNMALSLCHIQTRCFAATLNIWRRPSGSRAASKSECMLYAQAIAKSRKPACGLWKPRTLP